MKYYLQYFVFYLEKKIITHKLIFSLSAGSVNGGEDCIQTRTPCQAVCQPRAWSLPASTHRWANMAQDLRRGASELAGGKN